MTKEPIVPTSPPLERLLDGELSALWSVGDCWEDSSPCEFSGLLSGAFNPLHEGHLELQAAAARHLDASVVFELTAFNAEKPPLTAPEIESRRQQFQQLPLVLTSAATFVEKSRHFIGVTFVVGVDTALRIVEPRFYGGVPEMDAALNEISAWGCSFLVAARWHRERLMRVVDIPIRERHRHLFKELPVASFRRDLSSTTLRLDD